MKFRFPLFVLLLSFVCAWVVVAEPPLDTAWFATWTTDAPPYTGIVRTSQYLTMRDGVQIAVDLYLPANLRDGDKLPTILDQTRYWRNIHLRWPVSAFVNGMPDEITEVVEHGYAIVRVDARGSGASFGTRPCPWSSDEIKDGAEIVDWIIAQPWSSGVVGATGGSYEGTAAEFLAVNQHPAVKSVVPMFSLFDVYTDIAFPGGIHLEWFTRVWQKGTRAMDLNRPQDMLWWAPLATSGVLPIDADRDRKLLKAAIEQHRANYLVHDEALQIVYRDDVSEGGISMDRFSPHTFLADLRAANIPFYSYSGWYDGGYAHSAIKRFVTLRTPGSKLILGPWDHGGDDHVRPLGETIDSRFDHYAEVLRFFDYHLAGVDTGIDCDAPVHYYTMGADRWNAAQSWPPAAQMTPLYAGPDHSLTWQAPDANEAFDEYEVDFTAGTGDRSRWNCLAIDLAVSYPDRAEQDEKLLVYNSPPLERDLEATGHPLVTLYVSSTATDGDFFVYLEDVDEQGNVGYVTEGSLRAIHRRLSDEQPPYVSPTPYRTFLKKDALPLVPGEVAELTFDLNPTSYLFRQGHRIRLAVAGADADHFRLSLDEPPTIRLHRDKVHATRLVLPVVNGE